MNGFENTRNYNFNFTTFYKAGPSAFHTHFHPFYEILYFLDGDMTIHIADVAIQPKKNDLFFIPPNTFHMASPNMDDALYSRYVLQFDNLPNMTDQYSARLQNTFMLNTGSAPEIKHWFQRFELYRSTLSAEDFALFDRELITELLYMLSFTKTQDLACSDASIFSFIINYIDNNFATIQSVEEIASAAFISKSYLFHLFKERLDTSPKQYLQKKKVVAASILLRQGVTPSEAYRMVGFSEYSTFYRLYIKHFGIPPAKDFVK